MHTSSVRHWEISHDTAGSHIDQRSLLITPLISSGAGLRKDLAAYLLEVGILTCFNSLEWDPAMADSHYMDGFFLHYILVATSGHGVKVILQTIKDWLWMTAGTSGLHCDCFHRRLGQWNTLFTELCAPNLPSALAGRNSCYCFCGVKRSDAKQPWQQDEDRAGTVLDRLFSVRTLG